MYGYWRAAHKKEPNPNMCGPELARSPIFIICFTWFLCNFLLFAANRFDHSGQYKINVVMFACEPTFCIIFTFQMASPPHERATHMHHSFIHNALCHSMCLYVCLCVCFFLFCIAHHFSFHRYCVNKRNVC